MKIEELRTEIRGSRARVAATVRWEDCERPTQEVFFETDEAFADSLTCNPHAFLLACTIPAMHFGEARVHINGEICPELREGLITALSWMQHWYYSESREIVRIEAKTRSGLSTPRTPERAAFFFSGGIDSYGTLRANRLNFPLEHPWSIKDGLLVFGMELDEPEAFEHVRCSLIEVANDIGITLIPVYTNIYLNYRQEDRMNGFAFWTYEFQGAVLSAVAHALSHRLTVVSIAATYDIPGLGVWGSHPLLDTNYSSVDLRIRHDGVALSRFAKTKLIADWDVVLPHLRVCNQSKRYRAGQFNCGRCEKCVRTMLGLLACGALDRTPSFSDQNISEALVLESAHIRSEFVKSCYLPLIAPLMKIGRHDLVRAIEHNIAKFHRDQKLQNWKARVKQFDRTYFNNDLVRFKRWMSLSLLRKGAA